MKILISESHLEDFVSKEVNAEIKHRKGDPQTVEDWIADFFSSGGKITPDSFRRNLDKNWFIEKLNFISRNGTPLDEASMSISNDSKMEIQDEDIVEFIASYKSASDYWIKMAQQLKYDKMNYYSQEE